MSLKIHCEIFCQQKFGEFFSNENLEVEIKVNENLANYSNSICSVQFVYTSSEVKLDLFCSSVVVSYQKFLSVILKLTKYNRE